MKSRQNFQESLKALRLREGPEADDPQRVRKVVESSGFFSPAEILIAVELVEERLQRGAQSSYRFIFAEMPPESCGVLPYFPSALAGSLLGYSCYGEIPCTTGSYDLYWIVIEKSCQGYGLGSYLLRQTESRISEAGGRAIYAETSARPQYEPTRRFYSANGYHAAAELPDFYAPGDAKLIFTKACL